ncbi:MAG: CotH kinase family protein [Lachnospiraceae bacterium]|nr:CotH kinase family protein [Lachnospiraceae bacterium]
MMKPGKKNKGRNAVHQGRKGRDGILPLFPAAFLAAFLTAGLFEVAGHAAALPSPSPELPSAAPSAIPSEAPFGLPAQTASSPAAPSDAPFGLPAPTSPSASPDMTGIGAGMDTAGYVPPTSTPDPVSYSTVFFHEIGLEALIPAAGGSFVSVGITPAGGESFLFLPSMASPDALILNYKGNLCDLEFEDGTRIIPGALVNPGPYLSEASPDGSRSLTLHLKKDGSDIPLTIRVIASSGISGVFLMSADPVKEGREFVEKFKGNKTGGSMIMMTAAGAPVYAGALSQIKTRGNTTFFADKKPYQIKLAASADLTLTDEKNASKTWLLIANAFDPTLLHNTAAFHAAKALGINAPDGVPVDLYYDGQYRGNYLLCEKVETGKGRVEIADLEKENEKANAPVKLEDLPTAKGTNAYGGAYQYVKNMKDPSDISGGYLLELDAVYYESERSWFMTSTGMPIVVKSPENCSENEMIHISEYMERVLRAAMNGGTEPVTGEKVWDLADLDSFASYFVLQEMTKNADAYTSSTYFFLDRGGKLTAGPVWDMDDSYGVRQDMADASGFVGMLFMEPFMNLPDFKRAVKNCYQKNQGVVKGSQIDALASEITSSEKMNRILWNGKDIRYRESATWKEDIAYMKRFASSRGSWLGGKFANW